MRYIPEDFVNDAGNRIVKVSSKPLNALGWRAPFRNVSNNYRVISGNEYVEDFQSDGINASFVLKNSGGDTIKISVKSKYSLYETLLEFN